MFTAKQICEETSLNPEMIDGLTPENQALLKELLLDVVLESPRGDQLSPELAREILELVRKQMISSKTAIPILWKAAEQIDLERLSKSLETAGLAKILA